MKYLSIIILLTSFSCFSQNFMIPFRKGDLWGYSDSNGKTIVQPKYDSVSFYDENQTWIIYKEDKKGVINLKGKFILQPIYDSLESIYKSSDKHEYMVYKDDKVGYYLMDGTEILAPNYEFLLKAKYDRSGTDDPYLYFTTSDEMFDLINSHGEIILDQVMIIEDFYRGYYMLLKNEHYGLYSINDTNWIINPIYEALREIDYNNYEVELKKEYTNYIFFGRIDGVTRLIDRDLNSKEFPGLKYEDLFQELVQEDIEEMELMVDMAWEEEYALVNVLSFLEDANKNSRYFGYSDSKVTDIRIDDSETEFKFSVKYKSEWVSIPYGCDSAFCITDHGYLSQPYMVLAKEGKYGIYGLEENKILVPVNLDSITFSKRDNYAVLHKDKFQGLFVFPNRIIDEHVYIRPHFDEYVAPVRYRNFNDYYHYFSAFAFMSNNKMCLIGQNQVKFFK